VKFLVTTPQNLKEDGLYSKERALIADVREELSQGRRCQVYATYTGEKDVIQTGKRPLRRSVNFLVSRWKRVAACANIFCVSTILLRATTFPIAH